MAVSEAKMAKAKEVYDRLVAALRAKEWEFTPHEEDLVIVSGCTGDDFPIQFLFKADAGRECLSFHTNKFVKFEDDKLLDAAYAVAVANHGMVFGHFDLNLNDGSIIYTMSNSFVDADLGGGFFFDMLMTAVNTTDKYNDRFIMLSKGMIDLKKFIELEG